MSLYVVGIKDSVLIKGGVLISEVVWYMSLYVQCSRDNDNVLTEEVPLVLNVFIVQA